MIKEGVVIEHAFEVSNSGNVPCADVSVKLRGIVKGVEEGRCAGHIEVISDGCQVRASIEVPPAVCKPESISERANT